MSPGHHALVRRVQRDRRLAREDAGAGTEGRDADLLAEGLDRLGQIERGTHRAFGVVLVRHRRSPHRHDRVADELLDHAAIAPDQAATGLEVPSQEVANLFRVAGFGERREPDEVGEHDRYEPSFRGRTREHVDGFAASGPVALGCLHPGRRRPAADPHSPQNFVPGAFGVPHAAHAMRQSPTALAAELTRRLVRCATARAVHRGSSVWGRSVWVRSLLDGSTVDARPRGR